MGFRKGFGAVERAIEQAQSKNNGGGGSRKNVNFISWKDTPPDNKKIVRFVSEPYEVGIHKFVRCADGRNRDFVCANDPALEDKRWDCPICKTTKTNNKGESYKVKPTATGLALAVVREEEVIELDDGRRKKVLSDSTVTFDNEDGDSVTTPQFGIITQGMRNFWNNLVPIYNEMGTVFDRDYKIVRSGEKLNTTYAFIQQDPISGLEVPQDVLDHYGQYYQDGSTADSILEDWINYSSSEARYQKDYFGVKDEPKVDEDSLVAKPVSKTSLYKDQFDEDDDSVDTGGTSFASLRSAVNRRINSDD